MRIVIWDSNRHLVERIQRAFSAMGYDCHAVFSLAQLAEQADLKPSDLIILGNEKESRRQLDRLRAVKTKLQHDIQVIALVSVSNPAHIGEMLEAGVSDYICLPLRIHELKARVQVLQDKERETREKLAYGPYVFQRYPNQVTRDEKHIRLTSKEFELALLLFKHAGYPVSRAYISDAVWHSRDDEFTRTIDTHISRIRNKLALRPENGFTLNQVYGYGYQLNASEAKIKQDD